MVWFVFSVVHGNVVVEVTFLSSSFEFVKSCCQVPADLIDKLSGQAVGAFDLVNCYGLSLGSPLSLTSVSERYKENIGLCVTQML